MILDVNYSAPPTLSGFMDSNAFVRVIRGPIGSGKSSGCDIEILQRSANQAPHRKVRRTRWAVIRNTYRELEDTTRKTFQQWIPAELGKWHEQDFMFEMAFNDVHSEILFRALDRPADVRKVLSLELTGAYFNELREIEKEVFDGVQGRVGRYPSVAQGGSTWDGVFGDTNSWHVGHWLDELEKSRPEGFEFFTQPDGLSSEAENVANLKPGYYQRLMAGKDSEWIDTYIRNKIASSDKGSIYGELIDKLQKRGGLAAFEHPNDGMHVNFDLGVSDSTAMFWWRFNAHGMPDIVDWYEASGKGASHFFEVLKGRVPEGCDRARTYKISKIWLPHDARQRTFQTGVSTLELFLREFPGLVTIGPELTVDGGIEAGRWMLEQPMRIHPRCEGAVKRLRAYKFEWDELRKVFSKKPLHDWTSHTADDLRYVACVVRAAWQETHKPEPQPLVIDTKPPTVDQLMAMARDGRKSNRI